MTSDSKAIRKQQEQDRHRREILEAAVCLFAEHGYYQTTMQMIADRTEFSVGYLYKHFPGKEEMYKELVQFHMDHMEVLVFAERDPDLPPLEDFRRSLTRTCEHFNRYPEFMRIYHQEIGEEAGALHERKDRHHQLLVQMLISAQKRGELRSTDPKLLALAIQGAIKELFFELAEHGGEQPFDPLPGALFELMIDPLRP